MTAPNTKSRTITIAKKDVYFDMEALSISYADTVGGDNLIGKDRMAIDVQDANGLRTARRLADHRASDIRQLLQKFIETATAESANDSLSDTDWTFSIRITTEADDNILAPLADEMHEYIVSGALLDWYTQLGINGNMESLQNRCDAALARMRELVYYRPMPL